METVLPTPSAVILVVDDAPILRVLATDVLEWQGYAVIEASNAQAALTILENRTDVRVLFTDVKMPGELDGIGLAHATRERWPKIGLIITSGFGDPVPEDLPEGASFVGKPYSIHVLANEVAAVIQQSSG
jgi:DNA-binding NtrC family response regulator